MKTKSKKKFAVVIGSIFLISLVFISGHLSRIFACDSSFESEDIICNPNMDFNFSDLFQSTIDDINQNIHDSSLDFSSKSIEVNMSDDNGAKNVEINIFDSGFIPKEKVLVLVDSHDFDSINADKEGNIHYHKVSDNINSISKIQLKAERSQKIDSWNM